MSTDVLVGHAPEVMRGQIARKSVHCIVTSPPFWRARKYGTPHQFWPLREDGATMSCPHEWEPYVQRLDNRHAVALAEGVESKGIGSMATPIRETEGAYCPKCHSWRGELGQEPMPEEFVGHLVHVFGAARSCLRDDGTLWVNLGDSYYTDSGGQNSPSTTVSAKGVAANQGAGRQYRTRHPYLGDGDRCMIPALFAVAMQQNGWTLRQEITWIKYSPMPNSVGGTHWARHQRKVHGPDWLKWEVALAAEMTRTGGNRVLASANVRKLRDREGWDVWATEPCPGCKRCAPTDGLVLNWWAGRPTTATESIFQFVKKGRHDHLDYYYDQAGNRVPHSSLEQTMRRTVLDNKGDGYAARPDLSDRSRLEYFAAGGRNLWNWWAISPKGTAGELPHHASFPAELPEACISLSTSERGVCRTCGAPWVRIVERKGESYRQRQQTQGQTATAGAYAAYDERGNGLNFVGSHNVPPAEYLTLGWRPSCACPGVRDETPAPARVLDPFVGSGTTIVEAHRMGRHGTGIDLNEDYAAMTRKRVGAYPESLFSWR
jgi:DNA modification methylase